MTTARIEEIVELLGPPVRAGFDAAYDLLLPVTQHAQVRAEIAERVIEASLAYISDDDAVDAILADWPTGFAAIDRPTLVQVVQAVRKAMARATT